MSLRTSSWSARHSSAPAKAGAQGGRRRSEQLWAPAFAGALLLTACGGGEDTPPGDAEARAQAAESGIVYCAPGGAESFGPDCTIDRTQTEEGLVLTIRHPDGGFRRLLVTADGRGVIAADGAEPAIVSPVSDREIEVAIAADRYRLPATVGG